MGILTFFKVIAVIALAITAVILLGFSISSFISNKQFRKDMRAYKKKQREDLRLKLERERHQKHTEKHPRYAVQVLVEAAIYGRTTRAEIFNAEESLLNYLNKEEQRCQVEVEH